MMKRHIVSPLALSLLAAATLACSLLRTSTPIRPTATPEPPTATAMPRPSATPSASPSPTPERPTPTPMPTSPPKPIHIQFEPGATSAAVTGRVEGGSSRLYVLRALADQTMQVQATSANDIQIEIQGADGTVLKEPTGGETSWLGKLPSTQDYFISVISTEEEADYDLRVTVFARIQLEPGEVARTVTSHAERVHPEGAEFVGGYVLWALADQMMEVTITTPNDDVLLSIVGEDGVPLKRYTDGESRWRSTLPATQDYFIKPVSVGQETTYTLTVAIGPLGWENYRDETYEFEIWYPDDFVLEPSCYPVAVRGDVAVGLRLANNDYYSGTNLLDACVIVGFGQSEETLSTCLELESALEEPLREEEINGVAFQKWALEEGAAGNIFEEISYRTIQRGACYEIALLMHSGNIGVYPEGTVTEFNSEEVLGRLEQVLHTFHFLE